jgi:predicted aspartyl protease
MRSIRQACAALVVFVCTASASAQSPVEVRFDSLGELVFVQGSIGHCERLRFLIDTGASWTLVDRRVTTRLGLALVPYGASVVALDHEARAFRTVVAAIAFGPLRLESHPVLVVDLGAVPGLGTIDAVIGLDVLRRASFQIDYRSHRLTFGSPPPARSSVPFQTSAPLLSVDVAIGDQPVRLIVDTAASRLTLFPERLRAAAPVAGHGGSLNIVGLAGRTRVDAVDLHQVRLGDTVFPTYAGAFLFGASGQYEGFDGILGGLSRAVRRVGFDFERGRLHWE